MSGISAVCDVCAKLTHETLVICDECFGTDELQASVMRGALEALIDRMGDGEPEYTWTEVKEMATHALAFDSGKRLLERLARAEAALLAEERMSEGFLSEGELKVARLHADKLRRAALAPAPKEGA